MKKLLTIFASVSLLLLFSGAVFAAGPLKLPTGFIKAEQIYGGTDSAVCLVLQWVFTFALILSVLFILIAAYKYVFSGGASENTESARKTLTYAAVGVLVAILARGIPAIVGSLFPGVGANSSDLGSVCGGGGGGGGGTYTPVGPGE